MLRVIEKRQTVDDEKDRQGSVKYLRDLPEETEARIHAGLSMTNPAHLRPPHLFQMAKHDKLGLLKNLSLDKK